MLIDGQFILFSCINCVYNCMIEANGDTDVFLTKTISGDVYEGDTKHFSNYIAYYGMRRQR